MVALLIFFLICNSDFNFHSNSSNLWYWLWV